jgi:hypothetical protein
MEKHPVEFLWEHTRTAVQGAQEDLSDRYRKNPYDEEGIEGARELLKEIQAVHALASILYKAYISPVRLPEGRLTDYDRKLALVLLSPFETAEGFREEWKVA